MHEVKRGIKRSLIVGWIPYPVIVWVIISEVILSSDTTVWEKLFGGFTLGFAFGILFLGTIIWCYIRKYTEEECKDREE